VRAASWLAGALTRNRLARAAPQFLMMLFAGALGGYFAYQLGFDAEMAEFRNQYYASVSQVRAGFCANRKAPTAAAASCALALRRE
jgi:alkyl sulfatase BDS1-like metallo-beta-lactamase superfamily hydrolase